MASKDENTFGAEQNKARVRDNLNKNRVAKKNNGIFYLFGIVLLFLVSVLVYKYAVIDKENIVMDKSIAVLPFKNLSSSKENQYFADGIMEIILNQLSSIKELKVISRTSIEQYRETTKTAPEIAKALDVSYILEASVQKYEDEVRVIVQLIDAKSDRHIWTTDIRREFKNIFELQSSIAEQVAFQLKIKLSPQEQKTINKLPTQNLRALEAYFLRNLV